jgi:hypothetical protein
MTKKIVSGKQRIAAHLWNLFSMELIKNLS